MNGRVLVGARPFPIMVWPGIHSSKSQAAVCHFLIIAITYVKSYTLPADRSFVLLSLAAEFFNRDKPNEVYHL